MQLQGRLRSFGQTFEAGRLITAFDREIGWPDAVTGEFTALLVPGLSPGVRLNDGRVGPDGATTDLELLAVTTARVNLTEDQRAGGA